MKKISGKIYRKGDLLLIGYRFDPIGWLIQKVTKSKFNHVAWILNQTQILESGRYGVRINPINKYSNKFFYRHTIIRITNISKKKIDKALRIALVSTKRGNYLKQLWTFVLLIFKYEGILPRPTCSGLIAQALHKVGFKFKTKRASRITPEDMYESKYTRPI